MGIQGKHWIKHWAIWYMYMYIYIYNIYITNDIWKLVIKAFSVSQNLILFSIYLENEIYKMRKINISANNG